MTKFFNYINIASFLAASLFIALNGCGGSSSNSSNTVIPANLQTTLNTPTYLAGSEELAAFYAINTFRNSIGLGYWQQNSLLDSAAKHHMAYSLSNDPTFMSDIETPGAVGFTGTTPSKRAVFTGYYVLTDTNSAQNVPTASVGELYAKGSGAQVIADMLNTIYHRSGLMTQQSRDVGLARDTTGAATPTTHWWISHGRLDAGQSVASNFTAYYPMNQQTGVPLSMTPEVPSVYSNQPGFNFATQTSSPVSFITAANTQLTVTSFTVTAAGSTAPLNGTVWTTHNDPNLADANQNNPSLSPEDAPSPRPTISTFEAHWVGQAPFLPQTTYNVTFTGSVYVIPTNATHTLSQTWQFTTGS